MSLEDIYVAIEASKKDESIAFFIAKYLKNFKEEADYYEYPPFFGETEFETEDYYEMISFVLKGINKSYRFYFEDQENNESPKRMIFINKDGSVFLGLGVYPNYSSKYECALMNDFNSSLILICNETLPPDNLKKFKSLI